MNLALNVGFGDQRCSGAVESEQNVAPEVLAKGQHGPKVLQVERNVLGLIRLVLVVEEEGACVDGETCVEGLIRLHLLVINEGLELAGRLMDIA